jgi:hypothetical protein
MVPLIACRSPVAGVASRADHQHGCVRLHRVVMFDGVWIPAGVKHWHGAAPTTAMTHVAIQEALNGSVVTWLEKVSDAQYGAAPRTR